MWIVIIDIDGGEMKWNEKKQRKYVIEGQI